MAGHFERHCTYFIDGQILESARRIGTGKACRDHRLACQWKFMRDKHNN